MSKFPSLLLKKWAMTSSLYQNLFCQLQAKGEWLTILESLKKKNKHGCTYELKRIYICGVHLGLLPQTSLGGLRLWVILVFSIFISSCFGESLASGWPWSLSLSLPLPLCVHVKFPQDMCTSSMLFLFDCMGFLPACSIPVGYVHKFYVVPFWFVWGFVLVCLIPSIYVHEFYILICSTISWMKDPLGMLENTLGSIIPLRSVLVMILTYHEVLIVYGPLGTPWWCVAH